MPEVAPAPIAALVPIVGQLDLALVARDAEEDQAETARLIVHSPAFLETEQVEEADRGFRIGNPDHRVEVAHRRYLGGGASLCTAGASSKASACFAACPLLPFESTAAARDQ